MNLCISGMAFFWQLRDNLTANKFMISVTMIITPFRTPEKEKSLRVIFFVEREFATGSISCQIDLSLGHQRIYIYLICYPLGFFNFEPRVISAPFQRCRNNPGLEIANLFVTVPVSFAAAIQFSSKQINSQSLYRPITDSHLF